MGRSVLIDMNMSQKKMNEYQFPRTDPFTDPFTFMTERTGSASFGPLFRRGGYKGNGIRFGRNGFVNALMTAAYWEIGRRTVEFEQRGKERAAYGEELLKRLSTDLTKSFGRGFSVQNLENMRLFYQAYAAKRKSQTLSGISAPTIRLCPGSTTSNSISVSNSPHCLINYL